MLGRMRENRVGAVGSDSPGSSGGFGEVMGLIQERGGRKEGERVSKAQDGSWHWCLGAAPCQDTAHQSQTLNMSPDLLFFSKKKKKVRFAPCCPKPLMFSVLAVPPQEDSIS